MQLRVPTSYGSVGIEVDEKKTPLACRCLQYQILKNSWDNAEIIADLDFVKLVGSSFAPEIGEERAKPLQRGDASYLDSTNSIVFWTSSEPGPISTVLGRVSEQELEKLVPQSQQMQEALEFEEMLKQEGPESRTLRNY